VYFISKEILASTTMSLATKLVLAYVETACKETPQLAYETIAEATALTKMSAIRATKYLVDNGYIYRDKNEKGWYVYSLKGNLE
jgi:DNA-binding MarR family transcriptional regulator